MNQVDDINRWINLVVYAASVALNVWALIDCAIRKARAFPAAGKLTKVAWLAILLFATVLDYFVGGILAGGFGAIIGSASVVVALVYLCDVRPAVREISGGR